MNLDILVSSTKRLQWSMSNLTNAIGDFRTQSERLDRACQKLSSLCNPSRVLKGFGPKKIGNVIYLDRYR